jgi:hypothetical protein
LAHRAPTTPDSGGAFLLRAQPNKGAFKHPQELGRLGRSRALCTFWSFGNPDVGCCAATLVGCAIVAAFGTNFTERLYGARKAGNYLTGEGTVMITIHLNEVLDSFCLARAPGELD